MNELDVWYRSEDDRDRRVKGCLRVVRRDRWIVWPFVLEKQVILGCTIMAPMLHESDRKSRGAYSLQEGYS